MGIARKRVAVAVLIVATVFAACGGGNREALEKRVKGLQEEVTRLQNSQDRVAERLQALEIQNQRSLTMRSPAAATPSKVAAQAEGEVTRPPLKIVKLQPGAEAAAPAETGPGAATATGEEAGPRPVIKDHGPKKAPWWQKPKGKPGASAPRAGGSGVGQNESGARALAAPGGAQGSE